MVYKTGRLWGVNYERHHWGVYCYAITPAGWLAEYKYAGNGSDPVSIRESVRAFRHDVMRVA